MLNSLVSVKDSWGRWHRHFPKGRVFEILYSNWTRNNVLLECHINKTNVGTSVYHSGWQVNFKGKNVTLLSYTQPDVSTKVNLTFCDYDVVYIFLVSSFRKKKKISDYIIWDTQKEPWTTVKMDTKKSLETLVSMYNLHIAISEKREYIRLKSVVAYGANHGTENTSLPLFFIV